MIRIESLSKQFGSVQALASISLQVSAGEVFALLGPNGAGKSTTIKILTTLLKPSAGIVEVAGRDPVSDPASVRKCIGIVFQDPTLDDELTVAENLEFHAVLYGLKAPQQRRERMERMLRMMDLLPSRDRIVSTLSSGMRRRVEIARGLLHDPRVFFLDEPTLGLDAQTRANMWSHLRALKASSGLTVFFTTHYLEEAERFADRVAIIDKGRIIAAGTPSQLIEKTGTSSLEAAFLSLTGEAIRDEDAGTLDAMRSWARAVGATRR